jgi:hypothetical protein
MNKCPNFTVCENNIEDKEIICLHCNMLFGKWRNKKGILQTKHNINCILCSKINVEGISRPDCDHLICTGCFKNIYIVSNGKIENENLTEYLDYITMSKKCKLCN